MEFGPEIKVDGKRPAWLKDDDLTDIRWSDGPWFTAEGCGPVSARHIHWSCSTGIRLPVNHPYYKTPTPDERAVAPELLERMVEFVKRCADSAMASGDLETLQIAQSIRAALEPVDGDLVAAREVAVPFVDAMTNDILEGGYDSSSQVEAALAGIRRGRQLEKEGK